MSKLTGLTPERIANTNETYNIPIYQRLFEWDEDKIEQLLEDLFQAYKKNSDEPYYVGMLTSTGTGNNLVDGQQRFTVMTLIGIVMQEYYTDWNSFLKISEDGNIQTRLNFSARPDDQAYLECIVLNNADKNKVVINNKMEAGQNFVRTWLENEKISEKEKTDFSQYVFKKITFFISKLPEKYEGRDLNKYFESMNSTGRNLESHEIQKIESLKNLSGNKNLSEENATKIWNVVSQMDKPIVRKISENKKTEKDEELHNRFNNVLSILCDKNLKLNDFDFSLLNDYRRDSNSSSQERINESILEIAPSANKPEKHTRTGSYHGMLTFSEFLLQILYIQLEDDAPDHFKDISVNEFFDIQKLLETFKTETKNWKNSQWEQFFRNLIKYRILFDYYVILIPNEEDGPFDLEYTDNENEDGREKQKLRQYQAMLYAGSASKSFYIWLNPYLRKLNEIYSKDDFVLPSCSELTVFLKDNDNSRHNNVPPSLTELTYLSSPIYWFRRLDYYLWERNLDNANSDDFELINKFRFRRGGRSIEHLHPQDDKKQIAQWDKNNIDRFGNLCLISSSFNSTQSNDTLGVKIARIKDQIERTQLESIKMYEMYKLFKKNNEEWTVEIAEQHETEMYEILKSSFNSSQLEINNVQKKEIIDNILVPELRKIKEINGIPVNFGYNDFSSYGNGFWFYIGNDENKNYICFYFDSDDYRDLYYGIMKGTVKSDIKEELTDYESYRGWEGYKYFNTPYRNFTSETFKILSVDSSEFINLVHSILEELVPLIDKYKI